jgi:hypothetical protein
MKRFRLVAAIPLALLMTTPDGAGAQRQEAVQMSANTLLPCCTVQSLDSGGRLLVVKNTGTGELLSVRTPSTGYRIGQSVDLNAQSTAMAVTPFPVGYKKSSKIRHNEAWRLRTSVTISTDGRLEGQTLIESTDPLSGFTGGVEVLLVDRSANILHHSLLRTYGVQPNSSRINNWHEIASPNAVNKVRAIVIHHSHEPKVRLAAGLAFIRANSKDVFRVLTCTPSTNDDEDARAGLRRTAGNQSTAATIQCS